MDGLGSFTSVSSSAAAFANPYTYDSCGNIKNSTGHTQEPIPVDGAASLILRSGSTSKLLPGVVPANLIGSTIAAIAITPLVMWPVGAGVRNLCLYGPILWVALAA